MRRAASCETNRTGHRDGPFRPGERLDEQRLAARFHVSRTPIREALQQLVAAGLVTAQPNRGVFVASLGVRDVVERFEAMAALEGMCGRLAARRISDSERRALTEAHEGCGREATKGDADAYYYENERFHNVIYDACHNAFRRSRRGCCTSASNPTVGCSCVSGTGF